MNIGNCKCNSSKILWFVMILLISTTIILCSWNAPLIEPNTTVSEVNDLESKKLDTLLLNNELQQNQLELNDMNSSLTDYLSNTKLLNKTKSNQIDDEVDSGVEKYLETSNKILKLQSHSCNFFLILSAR